MYIDREWNQIRQNVNIWWIWLKGIWECFILLVQLLCKFEVFFQIKIKLQTNRQANVKAGWLLFWKMTWGSLRTVMWTTRKSHDSLLPASQRTETILYAVSEFICDFLLKLLVSDGFILGWYDCQLIIKLFTQIFKILLQELTGYQMIICRGKRKF